MLLFRGTPAAYNYTYGPAFVYRGPRSIDDVYRRGEPVVLVADTIPLDELRRIELTRVRGFVFELGTAADEDLFNFLMTEKRAAVIGCAQANQLISTGDMLIVDGVEGLVCANPTPEVLAKFQEVRRKGAPEDRKAALERMARAMLDGIGKEREEARARGEDPDRVPTVAEVKASYKQNPGLIYQMLAGLPLPNSPTAGHHGHAHAEGGHELEPERDEGGPPPA